MRNKIQSVIRVGSIAIFFIFILLLLNILIASNSLIVKSRRVEDSQKLTITPDRKTVEAGSHFTVTVQDDQGNPVSGVTVGIQSFGDNSTTNNDGEALLIAPQDWDSNTITIIANKSGYVDGEKTVFFYKGEDFWQSLVQNPYFPIFIGAVLLISVILFVSIRQKRSIYSRAKEITDRKTIEKYSPDEKAVYNEKQEDQYYSREVVRTKPTQDSKVEEIRITRPHKEKEIVPVKSEKDETEKVIDRKKLQKEDYDWFEGTDEMRYEIKKLTGEVDEENLDKWFEGIDGLKEKVDEKIKKKDKKKDNNT